MNNLWNNFTVEEGSDCTAFFKGSTFSSPATCKVTCCGAWSVVLSDGTEVLLNSDSRLSYPTVFKGN